MGAGILPGGEEIHRFRVARIAGIQNGHAVAEHVTDIEMLAVGHDLDRVRTPADVAVGNMLDPVADALRRDRLVLGAGEARHPGHRRHPQHALQMRAAAQLLHGFPLFERFLAA